MNGLSFPSADGDSRTAEAGAAKAGTEVWGPSGGRLYVGTMQLVS